MRSILIAIMLIVTVIIIYNNVADGDDGIKNQLNRSGQSMSEHISRISP